MNSTPGRVLAIASQKGGVGKTTLALNLSHAFASLGWKTLLMDADPLGSIGLSLREDLANRAGLAEVAAERAQLDDVLVTTRLPELSILLRGNVPPMEAATWTVDLQDGGRLGRVLDAARGRFELIVIDTPPGCTGSALGALRCADYVTVPLQAEPLAARSVQQFLELLAGLREQDTSPQLAALVLTMLQTRHQASLDVALESWRLFPDSLVLETAVPRDPMLVEASARGVPVALMSRRRPPVAAVFEQIAGELAARMNMEDEDEDERVLSLLD